MFNGGANPTITNCLFSGNSATDGGGMWNYTASPTVTNCTFSNNTGSNYPGMLNQYYSNPTVTNSILWGNGDGSQDQIVNVDSTAAVTYSDVQLGTGELRFGEGCIDANPMFADADGRLLSGSPCIDAGNDAAVPSGVTTDLDGNPRIQGLCVDMGAFEALAATPETMLAGLRTYIQQQVALGNIDAEMEVSLLAKVNAAIAC